ncbi:related to nucleoside diphosphate-sugar hydrolase of the MutT (NUDIX) family [Phialocephala subalpina]|uniref:Related to nucleoside diphosphate-sugar hydrolase of the MutT (NUDIX) family n=1 Tax=Phialocephala subalpina TaxID=576137 RepID=A0A1L7WJG4_9HELO|nr:related to nucleoside diphosphate-sugar hydrolase of the MutT (NUDIX) family [Phialocephala subalpina]
MSEILSFDLPGFSPVVKISLNRFVLEELKSSWKKDLDWPTFQRSLLKFTAFDNWAETLKKDLELQNDNKHPFHEHPFSLRAIQIQTVNWWGKGDEPLGFLMMKTIIKNDKDHELPGIVFLRGGSVAVLMILNSEERKEEKFVVMTMQPRVPAGNLSFWEIPAGMLDDEAKKVILKARKEIEEETGLTIPYDEFKDMTKMALESATTNDNSQPAMYPSPGGSDEYIHLLVWEKEMDEKNIMDLREKLTGLRAQGELITLKLVRYEDLWREGARDSKTVASWALYEGLKREGKL